MRPAQRGSPGQGRGSPIVIRNAVRVDPTDLREEGKSYLRRARSWSVQRGLPPEQSGGTQTEQSAEAVVAQPGEGPNL
jgi:hypothetical protein